MDRREFMEFAALGTVTSLLGFPAYGQSKSDRIVIVAEGGSNSLDVHTPGANRPSYGLCMMI